MTCRGEVRVEVSYVRDGQATTRVAPGALRVTPCRFIIPAYMTEAG